MSEFKTISKEVSQDQIEQVENEVQELANITYGKDGENTKLMSEHLVALVWRLNQLQAEVADLRMQLMLKKDCACQTTTH